MKDTLRVLVDWKCNLSCSYCCNENPQFRPQMKPMKMDEIEWGKYPYVCISGGEPLLFPHRIAQVAEWSPCAFKVLYTNGTLWNAQTADYLIGLGIKAVNVGLHQPESFDKLIGKISRLAYGKDLSVRFHVWSRYERLVKKFQLHDTEFKFWEMDDCDRDNEDRVILTDWQTQPEGLVQLA